MQKLKKSGIAGFGVAMAAIGILQLFYGKLSLMMVPAWTLDNIFYMLLAYLGNVLLIVAGTAIALQKRTRTVSLLLGATLLVLLLFSYLPYELFVEPYSDHLGTWTNALKALAFTGGAFVIAAVSPYDKNSISPHLSVFEKIIPFGDWFFATTIICFGIAHFLYLKYIVLLVPSWFPDPTFWTYFAGVALMGSGICIVLKIRVTLVANLLGLMIILWLEILHIPRVVADPFGNEAAELSSALSALAFSGTAFVVGSGGR